MINDVPQHRTDFMISLYQHYAEDLRKVRDQQRSLYYHLRTPMFDDIEGEWLYLLTRFLHEYEPVLAVEIGSGTGFSSSWMLRALHDNRSGHLASVDMRVHTEQSLANDVTQGHWTFFFANALEKSILARLPRQIDLLLIDGDHNSPMAEQLLDTYFPRVRSGGFACVHDIYMLPTPRQGEALAVFHYLDEIGVRPFTPSHCFPEAFQEIQQVRQELQFGENIHTSPVNSLLLFQVP